MKFVYLILGFQGHTPLTAQISDDARSLEVYGVSDLEEAVRVARSLKEKVDVIELCGGFGETGARAVEEAMGPHGPAVAYVVHHEGENEKYARLFGEK